MKAEVNKNWRKRLPPISFISCKCHVTSINRFPRIDTPRESQSCDRPLAETDHKELATISEGCSEIQANRRPPGGSITVRGGIFSPSWDGGAFPGVWTCAIESKKEGRREGWRRCWPKHGRLPMVDSKNTFGAKFWGKCEKQTFLQPNYQVLISANKYIIPLKSNKIRLDSIKMSESNCKMHWFSTQGPAQRSCIYLFILSRYHFLILSGIKLTNVSEMYTTFRGCMDEENWLSATSHQKRVDFTVCSVFLLRN